MLATYLTSTWKHYPFVHEDNFLFSKMTPLLCVSVSAFLAPYCCIYTLHSPSVSVCWDEQRRHFLWPLLWLLLWRYCYDVLMMCVVLFVGLACLAAGLGGRADFSVCYLLRVCWQTVGRLLHGPMRKSDLHSFRPVRYFSSWFTIFASFAWLTGNPRISARPQLCALLQSWGLKTKFPKTISVLPELKIY